MVVKWLSKLAGLGAGVVALLSMVGVASAQTTTLPIPPIYSSVDANGIDLQTGFLTVGEADLSIGDPAHGGLAHTRQWLVDLQPGSGPNDGSGANAGWRHGFVITIAFDSGTGVNAAVAIGGATTVTFTRSHPWTHDWTCDQKNGWTLAEGADGTTWTITARDGTIYLFSHNPNGTANMGSYYGAVDGVATSITKPDGEIITLSYQTDSYNYYYCDSTCTIYATYYQTRLISVQNNYGNQLHYYYGNQYYGKLDWSNADDWANITRVEAVNLGRTYCDPLAASCSGSFPAVTYTRTPYNDAGAEPWGYYEVVTKPSGGTRTYKTRSYYVQGSSSEIQEIKDGISSSSYIKFTYNGSGAYATHRVNSVTRNAVKYDYTYLFDSGYFKGTVKRGTTSLLSIWVDTSINRVTNIYRHGGAEYVSWDSNGRVKTLTPFLGGPYTYTYDDRANVTNITYNDNGNIYNAYQASFPSTCANVKTCNLPTSTTDALGNVTTYTYDATHGGALTVTSPAATSGGVQPQVRTTYTQLSAYYLNASGAIVAAPSGIYEPTSMSTCITLASCSGTADEVKTTIAYGSTGVANNLRPTSTTVAAGDGSLSSTTTVTYDTAGNKASEDGPLAGNSDVTTWAYNADRQVTQMVGPDPDASGPLHNRSVKTSYNANGQVTSVSTGTSNADGSGFVELNRSDTSYDGYARKAMTTATSGGTIQARVDYSYNAIDLLECTAVRMNPAVFASATTAACSLGTQGSFGPDRITHNVYDTYDRLNKVQTAYGLAYQRDEATYQYNTADLAWAMTDAKGNQTNYGYNQFRQVTQINYPSLTTTWQPSTTDYETLTYDAMGRLTNRRLRDGKQIAYTNDNLGRQTLAHMVNPVDANDRDIATSYDLLGRVTQVDDGAGRKVSYAYDALGRKLSESPQLTGRATLYQYDAGGRRTRLTWSDGVYVTYDYDNLGELLAIRENGATSGAGVLASFAYDDQGKPVGLTRGNGVNDTYSYDSASRLSGLTITHPSAGNVYGFAYNPAGQLVSRSMSNDAYGWAQVALVNRNYTVNGLNQYTASGAVVPSYDGRGNMTSAGSTAYVYDSKNHLTNFGSNGFGYDAAGRLVSQATPATRFVYDGSDLIAETDASNVILRRYVHIPGTDNVVTWYEGSGLSDKRWLAHDERGSVTLVTDTAGTSLGINAYDEYGIPASTNLGRFQYTGQTWLPELGMYNYKARIYSPTMGRFLQTDPIGYDDGPNWYNYAHGDPVNGTDPSGKATWEWSCYGNCGGGGYWNDSQNGHFDRIAPDAPARFGADSDGTATIGVTSDFKWVWDSSSFTYQLQVLGADQHTFDFPDKEKPQNKKPPCTPTQIRAQDIGEGIGAGGIKGAQLGGLVQKGGAAVATGSAFLLNPTGVLAGGEIAGLGTAIKGTGYATAAFGYGVALAAGGNVRAEFNDAAVRLIPLSGFFPDSWKNGIKSGLNAAENAAGVPNTGCQR